jgi:fructokinase
VFIHGKPLLGMLHPEIGHMLLPLPATSGAPNPAGQCDFHGACAEGLASGRSISLRWGCSSEELPADSHAWPEAARVLGNLCVNIALTLSPRRIILGGGVMKQPDMLPMVRAAFVKAMAGYLRAPELANDAATFLMPPGLGDDAGLLGAAALARRALDEAGELSPPRSP